MDYMSFNYKTTKIKGDVIVHGKIILENSKIFTTGCVAPTAYPFLYPVKADLEKKEGMHIYGDLVLENETWLVDGSVLGMVSGQIKAGSVIKRISKEEFENFISMSEDERIRNEIIEFIDWAESRGSVRNDWHQKKRPAEWIAYLEKQKEQKIARWKSLGECSDIPDGHYVVGWFRFGDFRLGVMCNGLFVDPNGLRAEQPKEVFYIPNANEEFVYAEHKPAEWSEEEKERLESIIRFLTFENENRGFIGQDGFTAGDLIHFLKSLRPQPHWKPSEEQMLALGGVLDYLEESDNEDAYIIRELISDLKLLYE